MREKIREFLTIATILYRTHTFLTFISIPPYSFVAWTMDRMKNFTENITEGKWKFSLPPHLAVHACVYLSLVFLVCCTGSVLCYCGYVLLDSPLAVSAHATAIPSWLKAATPGPAALKENFYSNIKIYLRPQDHLPMSKEIFDLVSTTDSTCRHD